MPPSGNPALIQQISEEIAASPARAIPFSDYMRLALYHPQHGYYAAGSTQRVGRKGDFYTSVSVGECFGKLLAAHFFKQQPELAQIVEQGANDGQLAADILAHCSAGIDYIIIEPFPAMRAIQQECLGDRVRWVESIQEIEGGITGRFVCNELLDAFPVQRVSLQEGAWRELHIDEKFNETPLPISSHELEEEITHSLAGRDLPQGYTTEIHLGARRWTEKLLARLQPGAQATIIDYGHEAEEYYAPHRTDGTLRGFRDHRQITNVFEHIGETDLTASVNFTRIAELTGAEPAIDQHHFLIETAKPWLAEVEARGTAPDAETQKLLRQFQTLIHPAHLGQSFKVLEFCHRS